MADALDDILDDPDMRSAMRKEFGSRYEMRARTLKARYGIGAAQGRGVRERISLTLPFVTRTGVGLRYGAL